MLTTATLWISLGLLAIASVLSKSHNSRYLFGGLGWIFLSIYWFLQPQAYIGIQDYLNAFLVIIAAMVSLFIAYIMFRERYGKDDGNILISLSRAASMGSLIYFLFADVELLNRGIISLVTDQAIWVVERTGFPVTRLTWNQFAVNGLAVEIILACTAIESIALFTGVISATEASLARKLKAFMISVPVIYILNLQRLFFTASAYGFAWFGTADESFHISEHIITKAGSMLALLLVSYMVLKILPEISYMIDGIWNMMRTEFRRLAGYN